MTTLLLIAALAILPVDLTVRDSAAISEVNHFYDHEGRLVFSQVIWWDESDNVIDWRMADQPGIRPQRDWRNGGYLSLWVDKDDRHREVRAACVRETWTQVDRELVQRERLPTDLRKGLSKR